MPGSSLILTTVAVLTALVFKKAFCVVDGDNGIALFPRSSTESPDYIDSQNNSPSGFRHYRKSSGEEATRAIEQGADQATLLEPHQQTQWFSTPSQHSQLRGNYGTDLYGSEDSIYSTIGYAESGYHPTGYEGEWEEEEVKWGGVSISSVFQMSLTALAFLAFGGFLLNLIAQAMKDAKGNNNGGMTTMSPETLVLVPLKRPKGKQPVSFRKRKKKDGERISYEDSQEEVDHGSQDLEVLYQKIASLINKYPYEEKRKNG